MISSEAATPSSQPMADPGTHEPPLTENATRSLLLEQGYELVERVHHIHASRDRQEWHICLVADLSFLTPKQFLQRFEEALSVRCAFS